MMDIFKDLTLSYDIQRGFVDSSRMSSNALELANMKIVAPRVKHAIKKVIFHDPATIVYWGDGSKTVVKVQEGDEWDAEKGLAMAVFKKIYGLDEMKKWLPKEEDNLPILTKSCYRCMYAFNPNFSYPCNVCNGLNKWVARCGGERK